VKLKNDDGQKLILGGMPHSIGWITFMIILGPILATASVGAAAGMWSKSMLGAIAIGGVGGFLGVVIFWAGFGSAITRERLELDRQIRRGVYRKWMILGGGAGKREEFAFDRVTMIEVNRRSDVNESQAGTGSTRIHICNADIRLENPEASIRIDSTSNGQEERVELVAAAVAEACGAELVATGAYA